MSLLAAAELQQLLHLSFCPYFFGVTPARAGASGEQKNEGTITTLSAVSLEFIIDSLKF